MPIEKPSKVIPELSTAHITGTVKDAAGVAIGSGSITTATLAIHNRADGAVIRAAGDISGNIDTAGLLDVLVTEAENALIDSTRQVEIHTATFKIVGTAADGTAVTIQKEVWLQIQNLDQAS